MVAWPVGAACQVDFVLESVNYHIEGAALPTLLFLAASVLSSAAQKKRLLPLCTGCHRCNECSRALAQINLVNFVGLDRISNVVAHIAL
jgi:hypothetical protein